MAASTSPIFLATPRASWVSTGTAANTNLDGTGTVALAFTAGANGSKVEKIILQHLGTNVDTIVRIFMNNSLTNGTAANNSLVLEVDTAANVVSQVAASLRYEIQVDLVLPAGYKLNCTTGTAIASGVQVTCMGGDY